jgi:hypothetical protein
MIKISRYILVATGILVASIFLPSLYWTIFEKVPKSLRHLYSCITDDFVIVNGEKRMIRPGRNMHLMSMSKYSLYVLPAAHVGRQDAGFNQGCQNGNASLTELRRSTVSPRKRCTHRCPHWPMLESQSGKVNLVMPDDYFRIDNGWNSL